MSHRPNKITIPPFGDFQLDEFEAYGYECSCYETRIEFNGIEVEIVVHPPETDYSGWPGFLNQVSIWIPEVLTDFRMILKTGIEQLRSLYSYYGEVCDESEMESIISNLAPEMLQIHALGDDEIAFAPTPHFPSLNLFVSFDAEWRVTEVRFDG